MYFLKKKRISFLVAIAILFISMSSKIYAAITPLESNKRDLPSLNWNDFVSTESMTHKGPPLISSCTLHGHNWSAVTWYGTPLNQWIKLTVYTAVDCDVDVRMKDRNGRIIWAENKAFRADDDQWRKFWCGPDVYSVEARLSTGNPFVNIGVVKAPCVTEYRTPAP